MEEKQTTKIESYKDLIVWQKSMEMVSEIYRITEDFPKHEQYGLASQMRRSAVSIPSNIAEGYRRGSRKDYRKFVLISFGSGAELETQLLIAQQLKYCTQDRVDMVLLMLDSVMRMLNKLAYSLKKPPTTNPLQPTPQA